jgi:capsular exopolysaccharide synthesis family protein
MLELSRRVDVLFEANAGERIALSDLADLSAFPWYPQELCVLSELKYPQTFDALLKATGMQEKNLKRVVGVLDRLGVIESVGGAESSEPQATPGDAVLIKPDFPFEYLIPVVTNAVLNEKLEAARNAGSFTSEQFKMLKVQITDVSSAAALKVITVSSPDPQDGKSLISANLAFSFAMDPGRRTIIVDCDLRSPSLGKYLGVNSEPGLLQYLANGQLSPYCFVRRLQNLYFMTAGGVAPNPIEILSMHKMRQLIETLKKDFDTIILDAPPYSPIADARVVTGLSDSLIMVVRRGKTSCSSTDRALKAIDRNKLLGIVFNDVQPMLFHTYYDFGYYYYGKKQRVYASTEKPRTSPKNYLEA